ncbi:replication protein RepA [Rhodocytophaga aerolata]|uniref:Replication protein RepA n=1 Tax=Rhodocytophaga aerolata TaxID=455078 RepID=A0ABT8RGS5_9BACT|nr:replication protein RepA [Rhodocytophaga aerolata]MDO1451310.1 replication protein RepA [Rhodocytophaga aerolata]
MITRVQKIAKQAYDNIVLPSEHNELLFQHAILCQVYLPYRDPGNEVKIWERRQGKACFAIHTTPVFNPQTHKYDINMGLPFGPKARLVLTHINTLALQQRTPLIEVAETFSSFVTSLGLPRNGKQIASIKNQLARLAASMISVAFSPQPRYAFQADSKIIKGFDLTFPKEDNQRVVWNNTIALSEDYFQSLMNHAVPLDKRHLSVLANNAMALDIYVWLAQRLHRVEQGKPEFVHWQGLKDQFGDGYDRIDNFKAIFRHTLSLVLTQYNSAKIEEDKNKGFILKCSPPPVPPKTMIHLPEPFKIKN